MVKRFAVLTISLYMLIVISSALRQTQGNEFIPATFLPQCTGAQGFDLLFYGDFGAGEENIFPEDPGLSSSYPYSFTGPPDLGSYTLTNNTTSWDGVADTWIDIEDNSTDPEGYMMVVDADLDASIFYETSRLLCPNLTYELSFDIINLVEPSASPLLQPNINVLINGIVVFNTGDIPQDATWYNFSIQFESNPTSSSFEIALQNNAFGDAGNDFALDNFSLFICGPEVTAELLTTDPICPGDSVLVSLEVGPEFANPFMVWEVYDETYLGWRPISDLISLTTPSMSIGPIPFNSRIRARVINDSTSSSNFFCFIFSNELNPIFHPLDSCFSSPITTNNTSCSGILGENIFPEGDFGSGSDQFGPPLTYNFDPWSYFYLDIHWPFDGHYTIINFLEADPCFGYWSESCWDIPIQDNSDDPEGYTLAVNGFFGDGRILYYETITNLCENTTYQFSMDVKNLINPIFGPNNPDSASFFILPNLDVVIGPENVPIDLLRAVPENFNTGDIINDGQWHTFTFTFTTNPGVSEISFGIRDNASSFFDPGNDFLLDNISFNLCGPSVSIFRGEICEGESSTLSAMIIGDQFDHPAIQWQESTDNGLNWMNLPGQTNTALFLANPVDGNLYRFIVAGSMANLINPNCVLSAIPDTIVVHPPITENRIETICEGESVAIGGQTFDQTGNYTINLLSSAGCDSTILLDLNVENTYQTDLVEILCDGQSITIGSNTYSQTGFYTDTLVTTAGCDSIFTLDLRVDTISVTELAADICEGQIYQVGASIYTQTGNYSNTFQGANGCDSIVNLALTVHLPSETPLQETICEGEFILIGTSFYTQNGFYSDTLISSIGCDSIVSLDLTVNQSHLLNIGTTICEGESYSVGDSTYTTPGFYSQQLSTIDGCDSIINLILNVNPSPITDLIESICEGESYSIGTNTFTKTGEYTVIRSTVLGCDSTINLDLTVFEPIETMREIALCEGDLYNDNPVYADSLIIERLTGVDGCDSTAITYLDIREDQDWSIVGDTTFCEGNFSLLEAPEGFSNYQWSNGENTAIIEVEEGGEYSVIISDDIGCEFELSFTVNPPEALNIELEASLAVKQGDSLSLNPIFNFTPVVIEWTPAIDLSCSDCTNPVATSNNPGTYFLTAWNDMGCSVSTEIQILVDNTRSVYIPNAFSPNNDGINDVFTIYGGAEVELVEQLLIFDRWGDHIFEVENLVANDELRGWNGNFNGKDLDSGVFVYFARIQFTDGTSAIYEGEIIVLK